MNIRTRFAPSPTGLLHLGNIRAAFFSALLAARAGGVFVLRIEDTDQIRSRPEYVKNIMEDLTWLGLQWQEGGEFGGGYGPYYQAQRYAIYNQYYEMLLQQNQAYYCFCSQEDLDLSRKLQLSAGKAPRYMGTCRNLSTNQINSLLTEGKKPTLRFKVPVNLEIEFHDLLKGPQKFMSDDLSDFIIRRSDNSASFMFCNAIDDSLMNITHVLRGEDHVTNTPCQLMVLDALKLAKPQYGHLPLIVGVDGAPLSKRHGSYSIYDLRHQGYLPQAILNYLIRLGHNCVEPALLSVGELTQVFDLSKLSNSSVRFDDRQLLYWQKIAVSQLSDAEFLGWMGSAAQDAHVSSDVLSTFAPLLRKNLRLPQDGIKWMDMFVAEKLNFTPQQLTAMMAIGPEFFSVAVQAATKHGAVLTKIVEELREKTHLTGKNLYHPLRIALTALEDGPELGHIIEFMGKDMIVKRLDALLNILQNHGGR